MTADNGPSNGPKKDQEAQVIPLGSGGKRRTTFGSPGGPDPSEAGKRGAQSRQKNQTVALSETREALILGSKEVARRLLKVAKGEEKIDAIQLQAMASVLDRTVGRREEVTHSGTQEGVLETLKRFAEQEQDAG